MTTQTGLSLRGRNPDVLSCIANLSNDEVFTPPEFADRMLDNLAEAWARSHGGEDIWSNPEVTFLDPFTKSGVFLRQITGRLVDGLADEYPNLDERVDHVLTKQVFGIGVTHLTSLLARRSVYCSKWANGEHSIAQSFEGDQGNIWFQRVEHTWTGGTEWVLTADEGGNQVKKFTNGRCAFCGASQRALDRGEGLETHAYAFIHTHDIKARINELFGEDMQFDVIIGNPPYQLEDGGYGTSAAPIYQKFVEQAKKLEPRLLTMVIPSRWFAGGKGLEDFREDMLKDRRVRSIDDFLSAADVFPGVGLKGGVCYFLWDRDNEGDSDVRTHFKDWPVKAVTRPLLENGSDVFLRFNEGVSILKKVMEVETGQTQSVALPKEKRFDEIVSPSRPFGLRTFYKGKSSKGANDILVYQNGGTAYIPRVEVSNGLHMIDHWKVYVGAAAPGTGNKDTYPHRILSTPFLGEPQSICSETYLCLGPLQSRAEAESVLSYLSCRMTRLLILLHKPSQHTSRRVYKFVPRQDWTQRWTDELLFEKYGITEEEQAFIDKVVRPMEISSEGDA